MTDLLSLAATALVKREKPSLVAATGLMFRSMSNYVPSHTIKDTLESYRGGVWGEESLPGIGYPVLRSTNMRGARVDIFDPAWCNLQRLQAESCALETGDILITKSSGSSDLVGKAAIFIHPNDGNAYLFSNFTLRLRPNSRIVHPEYLAWFLRSPQSLMWRFSAQQNAVGLRNLQTNEFLEQKIPIPSLAEQYSLVQYLDALESDNHGVNQSRLPSYLDEQRRIVARIEELDAKIEQAHKFRDEASAAIDTFVTSLHLELASGKTVKLGEILMLDEQRESVRPGCSYRQVGVKGFGGGLFIKGAIGSSETTYKSFNRLYEGAIVLSQVKGWEGAIAVCGSEYAGIYASPEYRTFRCNPQMAIPQYLDSVFITQWFQSLLKNLTRGVGARRERTRPEQFLELEIPMPTIKHQVHAVPIFAKLRNIKRLQTETSTELDALLPSVLDKAFKGEL